MIKILFILLSLFVTSPAFGALADSLTHCYEADESSGNLLDSVGSAHGTDNNTVGSTTGKIGNARVFVRANNEYFSLTNTGEGATSGNPFSWTIWANAVTLTGDRIILGWNDGTKLFQIVLGTSGLFVAWGVSPFDAIAQGNPLSTSTWYHVAFTFSSAGVGTAYINTTSIGSDSSPTGAFNTSTALNIGRRGGDGADPFDGALDLIKRWSREISTSEITEDYNSASGISCASLLGGAPSTVRHRVVIQ